MTTACTSYDRTAGDLGNIVELGHVNLRVPDQRLATLFYVTGLGLTRDPYMMTGIDNMWVNAGRTQFHLPTGAPQVLRGVIGLVLPDLDAVETRLAAAAAEFDGTRHAAVRSGDVLHVTCPWGNRLCCHAPAADGRPLGIVYVAFDVPPANVAAIAAFYVEVLGARARVDPDGAVHVVAGDGQALIFAPSDRPLPDFDGHHVQVTFADFSGPHRRLAGRGLITREDDTHQYRFADLVDPASGRLLFTVEHEVRSMRHPMFGRALVNRNPAQSNRHYRAGCDAFIPGVPRIA